MHTKPSSYEYLDCTSFDYACVTCFRRSDYVENDVDIDVYLTTVPKKGSTTGFSGNQNAALRLKWFPVYF